MNCQMVSLLVCAGIAVVFVQTAEGTSQLARARADIYIKHILYNPKYYSTFSSSKDSITLESKNPCGRYNEYVRIGTGVFLSETWIVTSSYLLKKVNVSDVLILTGRQKCQDIPQIVGIQKVLLHRYFNEYDHDVALIKVVVTIQNWNNTIRALKLPLLEPREGSSVTVSSWRNLKGYDNKMKLSKMTVNISNRDICQKYYIFPILTKRNLCAIQKKSKSWDFSIGDPITQGNMLIGFFQGNHHPGVTEAPAVYVNVAALRLWIKTTMLVN